MTVDPIQTLETRLMDCWRSYQTAELEGFHATAKNMRETMDRCLDRLIELYSQKGGTR